MSIWSNLGKKEGGAYSGVLIGSLGFVLMDPFSLHSFAYDLGASLRFLVSLFFVATISFALEASRARYLAMVCEEHDKLVAEKKNLEKALKQIKTLSGLIPICCICKKVRDDQGYWQQVEEYVKEHSEADFSHGMCPDCFSEFYPDYEYGSQKKNPGGIGMAAVFGHKMSIIRKDTLTKLE